MSVTEPKPRNSISEDEVEIRLRDVAQFLKVSRGRILAGALIGLVIGGLYAFNKPNVYTTLVTVMPEIQAKGTGGLGNLGSLAGLAGIDISSATGAGMDAIRPDIYPDILQSMPFALQLLQQPVYSQFLQKETSLQAFLEAQDRQSLLGGFMDSDDGPTSPINKSRNPDTSLQITKRQEKLVRQIHTSVAASYDKKTGIIQVTASFADPVTAADVARLSLEYLTTYITSYRTEKARSQVRFLTNQVDDAKRRYQLTEFALSSYKDQNRSLFLNTAKIEEQRLQADFMLAQTVFNDLSKQLEQAKIKVSEESPVFKILEPPTVPLRKSAPNRALILMGFILAGIVVGLLVSLVRRTISKHQSN